MIFPHPTKFPLAGTSNWTSVTEKDNSFRIVTPSIMIPAACEVTPGKLEQAARNKE
jgi:hypothetical protein